MMHRTPIQIRFVDTDMLGHVNNSNFLSYMEMARVSYFNTILPGLVDWSKEGIILAKADIQYKKPIFLNDQLFVDIAVDHLSSRSFNMRYRFIRTTEMGEELCAEGNTLMVCYDYLHHTSMSMPESWKKAILAHEGSIG